ncbi:unnamed protein product [Aphanomyces euteiches]
MEGSESHGLVYSLATVNTLKRKAPSIASEDDKENQDLDDSGFLFSPSPNRLKRKANFLDMPKGADTPSVLSASRSSIYSNQLDSPRKRESPIGLNHTFLLNNFQHVPSLDFGVVQMGQSSTLTIKLSNPSEFGVANVVVEDILPKTVASSFFVDASQVLVIPMQSSSTMTVTFSPNSPGRTHAKLYIRLNKRFRLFCSLQGSSPPSSKSTEPSLRSSISSLSSSTSITKRPKLAKQPTIPQTSSDQEWKKRRMVYDANWIPKQEAGFQKWLNFTLLGAHFIEIQDETPLTQDRYYQLRQLAITRLESKIRVAAKAVYHNPQTDHILYRLQQEITARRLTIRADRPLHVDVGLQQDLMDLFNSYHPLWLTLAFEVVLGIKLVASLSELMQPASSRMPQFLRRTIIERIVQDPAVKVKAGSTENVAKLRVITLVRCFMVVYFLDQAHQNRHVDHVALPCLFRPTSTIKRSKQMLIEICQRYLAQEGNVLRHLYNLEYEVCYQQSVLEEMDMQVQNLALDLRDGMRLVRLMETLDPANKGLSQQLRLPAVSRLQKVHNVQVTLTCLQERYHMPLQTLESSGVTRQVTGITAKDIVDGHREKTLALLWQIISYFKLAHVVKISQLEMEIERIRRRRRVEDEAPPNYSIDKTKEPIAWLLLEWCRLVCAHYNVPIRNFTASFADGKALCLMVHYYHPRLLEKWEIQWTTSDTKNQEISSVTPLLANERANFALVNQKVKQLGQIPVLLPLFDSEHLPEEKVILTFLAYLHARLLGASREIHAAFTLQHWWVPRFRRTRIKKRNESARVLQRFWASTSITRWVRRSIHQRMRCICKLQAFGRMVLAKREVQRRRQAAQTLAPTPLSQPFQLRQLPTFEEIPDEKEPEEEVDTEDEEIQTVAAMIVQRWWRRWQDLDRMKRFWTTLIKHGVPIQHTAARVIQTWFRRWYTQSTWYAMVFYLRLIQKQHAAASKLQRWWSERKTRPFWLAWGFVARGNSKYSAARRLQAWWRTIHSEHHALQVQTTWNSWVYQLVQRKAAVRTLEAWWHTECVVRKWHHIVFSAVDMQRQDLWDQVLDASAARIQRWWRQSVHLHSVQDWWMQLAGLVWEQHMAARRIQRVWAQYRIRQANAEYEENVAAIRIQQWYRNGKALSSIQFRWTQLIYALWEQRTYYVASSMIQNAWRRYSMSLKLKSTLSSALLAATRIQKWWRQAKSLCATKQMWTQLTIALWERRNQEVAATIVQQFWRQRRQENAASRIQLWWIKAQHHRQVKNQWTQLTLALWNQQSQQVAASRIQLWWVKAQHHWHVKNQWTQLTLALWNQQRQEVAATIVQRWYRGHKADKADAQLVACSRIQRWWRITQENRQLAAFWLHLINLVRHTQRKKAAVLQTWVRTCLMNQRTLRIQQKWNYLAQRSKIRTAAATEIQMFVRRYQQIQWWKAVVMHVQNQHAAAVYIQQWWRSQHQKPEPTQLLPAAPRVWKVDPVVVLQKWWRGMRVRMRCAEPITIMRHRVIAAQTSAVVATLALREQSAVYVQESNIPLRYRLKRALAILNTSPRLHEMLHAVHTLEMCTRLSRECCVECIAHRVPRLLYSAIRKCNRSRPHLELLHQLLQVCLHLKDNDDLDGVALSVDLWIDIMQMHRDSSVLFMLGARLCKHSILALRNAERQIPEDTPRRLRLLHNLLTKKAKTKSAVDRVAIGTNPNGPKDALHPQRASAVLNMLLGHAEDTHAHH